MLNTFKLLYAANLRLKIHAIADTSAFFPTLSFGVGGKLILSTHYRRTGVRRVRAVRWVVFVPFLLVLRPTMSTSRLTSDIAFLPAQWSNRHVTVHSLLWMSSVSVYSSLHSRLSNFRNWCADLKPKAQAYNTYMAPQAAYRSCSGAVVSQTKQAHSLQAVG